MKRRNILILTYLVLFAIVVAGVMEFYLRAYQYEVLKTQSYPLIYKPDDLNGYSYIPKVVSDRIIPSYNSVIKSNSHGFFGNEFLETRNNKFRILIVSYSLSSFGEYSKLLNDEFRANGLSNVEVINCSIDGNESNWHHYLMIKKQLLKYNPDLILFDTDVPFQRADITRDCYRGYVIEYSPYSAKSRQSCIDGIDIIERNWLLTGLYDYSYIVRAYCKFMVDRYEYEFGSFTQKYIAPYRKRKILSGDYKRYDYSVEQTMKYLKNLSDTVHVLGSELVVFNHFTDETHDWMNTVLKLSKVNYLNLGLDRDFYVKELALEFDGHPSDKGFQEISKTFFVSLINFRTLSGSALLDQSRSSQLRLPSDAFYGSSKSLASGGVTSE